MKIVLLANAVSTLFMLGLIWFVQIVHYPLFSRVGGDEFKTYEELHQRLTTWVVGPAMLIELVTALMLLKLNSGELQALAWGGVILVVVIWLSTGLLSVPAHNSLAIEYSTAAWQTLVFTNWIRTAAWTLRAILVTILLHRAMS